MEKKISEAVLSYGMGKIFEGAIVGFSGGADSSAVLHYLKDRCACVLAVHINHMIRGEEADRDELFCKSIAEKYGVEFLPVRVDVPSLAKERKKGLEETARDERYRIFGELLQKNPKYKCIVTAHNANDNGETVIFNLARGSGANGICGIKPVSGNIVRPLIYCTREDIIKYCLDNNIEYVTDSTNSDTDYTRNNIRHNILPQLLNINPNFLESCSRLGEILRRDEEYICKETDLVLGKCDGDRMPKDVAEAVHSAVLSRVLKRLSGVNLDYVSVNACLSLVENWHSGKMVNLANGITFKTEHSYCHFIKTEDVSIKEFCSPLAEGINFVGDRLVIGVGCDFCENGYEHIGTVRLNKEGIDGSLYVRSRKEGDTIKSTGITKKLKKVFTDKHIPSEERWQLPVICDNLGVLAVPGIIARDGAFDKFGKLIIKAYKKQI